MPPTIYIVAGVLLFGVLLSACQAADESGLAAEAVAVAAPATDAVPTASAEKLPNW
ncbi:hypothetical protein ACFLWA_03175 [Chloroflexota bacterium]